MAHTVVPSTNVIPPTPTGVAGSTGGTSNPSNDGSIRSTLSSFVSSPLSNRSGLLGKLTGHSSDDKETWSQWTGRNLGALGGWTLHQLVCAGSSRLVGELAGALAAEKAKENPLVAVGLGACLTAGYALRSGKAWYRLATETKEESDYLNAVELGKLREFIADPSQFTDEQLAVGGRRRKITLGVATAVNLAAGASLTYLGYARHLDASRGAYLETVTNLVMRSHIYAVFRDGLQGMFGLVDSGSLPPTQAETRLPAAGYAIEQVLGGLVMDYVSAAITNPLYKAAARSAINAFIEALDNFQLSAVLGAKVASESDKGKEELQRWKLTAGLTKNIFHKILDQSITREALLHLVNASFVGIALLSEMNDKTKSPEAGVNLLQSIFVNTLGAGVIGLLYGPIVATWFWQGTQRNLDPEEFKRTMEDLEKGRAGSGTGSGSATPPEELQGVTVETHPSEGAQAGGGTPAHDVDKTAVMEPIDWNEQTVNLTPLLSVGGKGRGDASTTAHDDGTSAQGSRLGGVAHTTMTREQEGEWLRQRRAQQRRGPSNALSATGNALAEALGRLSAESDSSTRPEMPNSDYEREKNKIFAAGNGLATRLEQFARAKADGDTGAGTQNTQYVKDESSLLAEAIAMLETIQNFMANGEGTSNWVRNTAAAVDHDGIVIEEGQSDDMGGDAHSLWSAGSFHVENLDKVGGGPRSTRSNTPLSFAGQPETTSESDSRDVDSDVSTESREFDDREIANVVSLFLDGSAEKSLTAVTSAIDEYVTNEEDLTSDEDSDLQMLEVSEDSDTESEVGDDHSSNVEEPAGDEEAAGALLDTSDGHSADAPSVEDEQAMNDDEASDAPDASMESEVGSVTSDAETESQASDYDQVEQLTDGEHGLDAATRSPADPAQERFEETVAEGSESPLGQLLPEVRDDQAEMAGTGNDSVTSVAEDDAPELEPTPTPSLNDEPQTATFMLDTTLAETYETYYWEGVPEKAKVIFTESDDEIRETVVDSSGIADPFGKAIHDLDSITVEVPRFNQRPQPQLKAAGVSRSTEQRTPDESGVQGKRKNQSWFKKLSKKATPEATSNLAQAETRDVRKDKGNKLARFMKKVSNPFKSKVKGAPAEASQPAPAIGSTGETPGSSTDQVTQPTSSRSRKGKERADKQ